jgi:hypothetical protein
MKWDGDLEEIHGNSYNFINEEIDSFRAMSS